MFPPPPSLWSCIRYVQALKIDRVSSFHDDAAFHAPQVGKLKRTMSNFANRVRDPALVAHVETMMGTLEPSSSFDATIVDTDSGDSDPAREGDGDQMGDEGGVSRGGAGRNGIDQKTLRDGSRSSILSNILGEGRVSRGVSTASAVAAACSVRRSMVGDGSSGGLPAAPRLSAAASGSGSGGGSGRSSHTRVSARSSVVFSPPQSPTVSLKVLSRGSSIKSRSDRGSSAGGHSARGGGDWEEYRDEATGDLCFYNAISGETRWADEGAGMVEDALMMLESIGGPRSSSSSSGLRQSRPPPVLVSPRSSVASVASMVSVESVRDGAWVSVTSTSGGATPSTGQGEEAWARFIDDTTGRLYMHHAETGQSVWLEDLTDDAAALQDVQREHDVVPLGARGWDRHVDEATECQFFYHASSGFSSWVDDRSGSGGGDDE